MSSHTPLSYPRDGVAGVDHFGRVVEDRRRASDRETALKKAGCEQGAHASVFLMGMQWFDHSAVKREVFVSGGT